MGRLAILFWSVGGATACGDDISSPEPNPFVGVWMVVEVDGVASSPGSWTFDEEGLTIDYGTPLSGTYSYDAAASPARLDITLVGESTNLGIYEFPSSGVLRLKVQDGASDRATDFSVDSGYDLLTLNRGS